MSFCTQKGPHISAQKPVNIYQDNKNRSTYSLLFNYNNNGKNGPIQLPPPQFQTPSYFKQDYYELPIGVNRNYFNYITAYPKTCASNQLAIKLKEQDGCQTPYIMK